jgi:hypothetical protein
MFLTEYTTYDEVRAALGVASDEIEDSTLDLRMYSDMLQVDLEDIHVNLPATYTTKKALATPSDDEKRFLQAAHLFATYAVAKQLTTSLPLFSPEQIGDGKAVFRRTQETPYAKVISAVGSEYSRFRARLETLFGLITSSASAGATPKTYFGIVAPSYDPITGA